VRLSNLFLLASVFCERIQQLPTFVLWGYRKKRIISMGIQQLASSMLIGCLTRRSSRRNELGAFYIARKGRYKIERNSVNLFRHQQLDSYRRRSLAPVR